MTLRIAFAGKARSGKDSAVELCLSAQGGTHLKFATKLHDICRSAWNELGLGYDKDRELLQAVGQSARRHDENVWIRHLLLDLDRTEPGPVFVSDVRYQNEAATLRCLGFVIVRMQRLNLPEHSATWRQHASETDLDAYPFDYVIHNSTLEHLEWQVDRLIKLAQAGEHLKYPRMAVRII